MLSKYNIDSIIDNVFNYGFDNPPTTWPTTIPKVLPYQRQNDEAFKIFLERLNSMKKVNSAQYQITEDAIIIALPGVKKQDIDITVTGGELSIRAKKSDAIVFDHTFKINEGSYDPKSAKTKYEDGELTITFTPHEYMKPTKIDIE